MGRREEGLNFATTEEPLTDSHRSLGTTPTMSYFLKERSPGSEFQTSVVIEKSTPDSETLTRVLRRKGVLGVLSKYRILDLRQRIVNFLSSHLSFFISNFRLYKRVGSINRSLNPFILHNIYRGCGRNITTGTYLTEPWMILPKY